MNTSSSSSKGQKTKSKAEYFSKGSEGYTFLADSFKRFGESNGTQGIDPFISDRKRIYDIYDRYAVFSKYSRPQFPQRFTALASKYQIASYKDRKRLDSPSKDIFLFSIHFFTAFISFNFFFLSFPANFKDVEADPKKRKLISFSSPPVSSESETSFKPRTGILATTTPSPSSDLGATPLSAATSKFLFGSDEKSEVSEQAEFANLKDYSENEETSIKQEEEQVVDKDEDEDNLLANMMKQVNIQKKAPRSTSYEHEIVYFQDSKHNKMVAIKIRLPSATLASDIDIKLKLRGKTQYLCVTHQVYPKFWSEALSIMSIGDILGVNNREWHNYRHEQEKVQTQLRKAHGKWVAEDEEGQGEEPIMSVFELKLNFICDDIFDETLKEYPKTGFNFSKIAVPGETNRKKDVEFLTILTIVLVSKVKEEIKKGKNTPVKKQLYIGCEDLVSSEDEAGDDDCY